MYDITHLCQVANISQQTFYRLVRDNTEFKVLIESNREKFRNSYRYNDTVLQWLCSFYNVSVPAVQAVTASEEPEKEENDNSLLLNQIEDLKAEIAALKSTLEEKESERKQLFAANQNLLLLLSQEKAEKQLLLQKEATEPDQKQPQTFLERLKGLFKK